MRDQRSENAVHHGFVLRAMVLGAYGLFRSELAAARVGPNKYGLTHGVPSLRRSCLFVKERYDPDVVHACNLTVITLTMASVSRICHSL